MEAVQSEADLLHVVRALRAGSRIAYFLHGGDQQGDEDRDDGDDHQQLDKRETAQADLARGTHF